MYAGSDILRRDRRLEGFLEEEVRRSRVLLAERGFVRGKALKQGGCDMWAGSLAG